MPKKQYLVNEQLNKENNHPIVRKNPNRTKKIVNALKNKNVKRYFNNKRKIEENSNKEYRSRLHQVLGNLKKHKPSNYNNYGSGTSKIFSEIERIPLNLQSKIENIQRQREHLTLEERIALYNEDERQREREGRVALAPVLFSDKDGILSSIPMKNSNINHKIMIDRYQRRQKYNNMIHRARKEVENEINRNRNKKLREIKSKLSKDQLEKIKKIKSEKRRLNQKLDYEPYNEESTAYNQVLRNKKLLTSHNVLSKLYFKNLKNSTTNEYNEYNEYNNGNAGAVRGNLGASARGNLGASASARGNLGASASARGNSGAAASARENSSAAASARRNYSYYGYYPSYGQNNGSNW